MVTSKRSDAATGENHAGFVYIRADARDTLRPDMAITEEGLARIEAVGLKPEQLPRHIAIIMDGNGRWAQRRGLPRIVGHRRGIQSVRAVTEEGCRLGLDQLTLYCLSVENWKRPPRELTFLMRLLRHFLVVERSELIEQNVQLKMIGRRDGLPEDVMREFERTAELTASNDGMVLCLAVNYGGRSEIADAARRLAEDIRAGRLDPDQVDEATFASYLYTDGMSDPDLLIRTAGEMRISNFLLWQISYAELWITPTLWPDFRGDDLLEGCRVFAGRERKFGGLPSSTADMAPARPIRPARA
jgi:undecaprenyl diphosphate synthase